uniref:Uncharacterized protein n=1 Tax=Rhizophora mucronata TaxID=61149 RepID=A0A2P2PKP6_RHIMU
MAIWCFYYVYICICLKKMPDGDFRHH